jgi:glycosyltransferase involved in cell wall biosynthesis
LFVSWIHHHGRSAGVARALGVPAVFVAVGRRGNKFSAPWRYFVQATKTMRLLWVKRPTVLYVMAPPLPLVLIGLAYQAVTGSALVVDAHTGAVLDPGGRPRRLFAFAARRARAVVVTTEPLAGVLRVRGVTTLVLHDAPFADTALERVSVAVPDRARPLFVMPASWYPDEPLDVLCRAACLVPGIDIALTGRPAGPLADRGVWPDNVTLTGWLDTAEYVNLIESATAIVGLTTRDLTMQRAGYEALILGRPAVLSDTSVLTEFFTKGAVFTPHEPVLMARAFEVCLAESTALAAEMRSLRSARQAEFKAGIDDLLGVVR